MTMTIEATKLYTALEATSFQNVSGIFIAVLECIFDIQPRNTSPSLAELMRTDDGFLLGRQTGDLGFNEWLGEMTAGEIERNVRGMCEALNTPADEIEFVVQTIRDSPAG